MYELRASELGRCVKASAAVLLGYAPLPTPEKMQVAYDRGTAHEADCIAAMEKDGYYVWHHDTRDTPGAEQWRWDEDQIYVLQLGPGWTISGHLDGVVASPEIGVKAKYRVLECKAPGAWAKFRDAYLRNDWSDPLAHRYAWQISVYMIATGLEALVCCLDDGDVKTFGIEVPPFSLERIEERARDIIWFVENGLPPICSQNDWPCPVAYLHETPEVEEDEVLDELVTNYLYDAKREKDAKTVKERTQQSIRAHLAGTDRTTAASKVTFYEQKGATKWDDNRLDALFSEMGWDAENYRVTGKPSARMKITKRGSDSDDE